MANLKRFWNKYGVGYLFFIPFFLLFVIFTVIPVIVAFITSFTDYNMMETANFIGITNYSLLFVDDDIFALALKNTFVFALFTGPIGYLLSFFMAWVINQLKFKSAFAFAFYVPSITSSVAMSVVWLYFFSNDRYGLINNIMINFGFIESPILWTLDINYIMKVIIFVQIWMSMGTGFLVFLAGLQSVPRELYEQGKIDGISNRLVELRYITFPCVKPQLLFGAINAIVAAFGVFDIAVSIAGMPSPQYAGHTIVAHLYDYAFIRFQMGYASAIAIVLFVLTFAGGKIVMRLLSSKGE